MRARVQAYTWFHVLMASEPTIEKMQWLSSDESLEVLDAFLGGSSRGGMLYSELRAEVRGYVDGDDVEALRDSYTRLFLGPAKLPINQWESTYLRDDDALFNEETLAVRRAYVEAGFLPEGYPNVADDAIAIEIDFMVALGNKMLKAYFEKDYRDALLTIEQSRSFADEHLLVWLDAYAEKASALEERYRLYRLAIASLPVLVRADREVLSEISDDVLSRSDVASDKIDGLAASRSDAALEAVD